MWWLSLKAEINCTLPSRYGAATPMHIAVTSGRSNTVAFLALVSFCLAISVMRFDLLPVLPSMRQNGSDLYAVDDDGRTPLKATALIEDEATKVYIYNILDQIQQGEY